jgi:hypothetical protein
MMGFQNKSPFYSILISPVSIHIQNTFRVSNPTDDFLFTKLCFMLADGFVIKSLSDLNVNKIRVGKLSQQLFDIYLHMNICCEVLSFDAWRHPVELKKFKFHLYLETKQKSW